MVLNATNSVAKQLCTDDLTLMVYRSVSLSCENATCLTLRDWRLLPLMLVLQLSCEMIVHL